PVGNGGPETWRRGCSAPPWTRVECYHETAFHATGFRTKTSTCATGGALSHGRRMARRPAAAPTARVRLLRDGERQHPDRRSGFSRDRSAPAWKAVPATVARSRGPPLAPSPGTLPWHPPLAPSPGTLPWRPPRAAGGVHRHAARTAPARSGRARAQGPNIARIASASG